MAPRNPEIIVPASGAAGMKVFGFIPVTLLAE
jgi:hypothetical protein